MCMCLCTVLHKLKFYEFYFDWQLLAEDTVTRTLLSSGTDQVVETLLTLVLNWMSNLANLCIYCNHICFLTAATAL